MGSVIYRRITNVLEIPMDILVDFIGRGLTVTRKSGNDEEPITEEHRPLLEPLIKEGLYFDEEGAIGVKTGLGLQIDGDNRVGCDLGSGLFHAEDGKITVSAGSGLTLDEEENLSIDLGDGLKLNGNKLCADNVVDPSKSTEFTVQVDSSLSMDAQKLSLKKMYQKYTVLKNASGLVLEVVPGEITDKTDEVIIAVPYGYGYGGGGTLPYRAATQDMPNFYKK